MDFAPMFDMEPPPLNDDNMAHDTTQESAPFATGTDHDWSDFSNFESVATTHDFDNWSTFSPPPLSPPSIKLVGSNKDEAVKKGVETVASGNGDWGEFSQSTNRSDVITTHSPTVKNSTTATSKPSLNDELQETNVSPSVPDYSMQLKNSLSTELDIDEKSGFGLFYKDDDSGEAGDFGDFSNFSAVSSDSFDNIYFKNDIVTSCDSESDFFHNESNMKNVPPRKTDSNNMFESSNFAAFTSAESKQCHMKKTDILSQESKKESVDGINCDSMFSITSNFNESPKHEESDNIKEVASDKINNVTKSNRESDSSNALDVNEKNADFTSHISDLHTLKNFDISGHNKEKVDIESKEQNEKFGDSVHSFQKEEHVLLGSTKSNEEIGKDFRSSMKSDQFGNFNNSNQDYEDHYFGTDENNGDFGDFDNTNQVEENLDLESTKPNEEFVATTVQDNEDDDFGTDMGNLDFVDFDNANQIEENLDLESIKTNDEFVATMDQDNEDDDFGTVTKKDDFGDFDNAYLIEEHLDLESTKPNDKLGEVGTTTDQDSEDDDFGTEVKSGDFGNSDNTNQIKENIDLESSKPSGDFEEFDTTHQDNKFGAFRTELKSDEFEGFQNANVIKEEVDLECAKPSDDFGEFDTTHQDNEFGAFRTELKSDEFEGLQNANIIKEDVDLESAKPSDDFGEFGTTHQDNQFGAFRTELKSDEFEGLQNTNIIKEDVDLESAKPSDDFGEFGTTHQDNEFGAFRTELKSDEFDGLQNANVIKEDVDLESAKPSDDFGEFGTTHQDNEVGAFRTELKSDEFEGFQNANVIKEEVDLECAKPSDDFGEFGTTHQNNEFGAFPTELKSDEFEGLQNANVTKEDVDLESAKPSDDFGEFGTTHQDNEFGAFPTELKSDEFEGLQNANVIKEEVDLECAKPSDDFGEFDATHQHNEFGAFRMELKSDEFEGLQNANVIKEDVDLESAKPSDDFGEFGITHQDNEFGAFRTELKSDEFEGLQNANVIKEEVDLECAKPSDDFGEFGTTHQDNNFGGFRTELKSGEFRGSGGSSQYVDLATSNKFEQFGDFDKASFDRVCSSSWNPFPDSSNKLVTSVVPQLVSKCSSVVMSCFAYLDTFENTSRKRLYDLMCHLNNSGNPEDDTSFWADLQMDNDDDNRWLKMYFVSDSFKAQIMSFTLDFQTILKKNYAKSLGRLTPSLSPANSYGNLDVDAAFGILQPEPVAMQPSKNTLLAQSQSKKGHIERVPSVSSLKRDSGSEPTSETTSLDLDFFITGSSSVNPEVEENVNLYDIDLSAVGKIENNDTSDKIPATDTAQCSSQSSISSLEQPTKALRNSHHTLRQSNSSDDGVCSVTHNGDSEMMNKNLVEVCQNNIIDNPFPDSLHSNRVTDFHSREPPENDFDSTKIESFTPDFTPPSTLTTQKHSATLKKSDIENSFGFFKHTLPSETTILPGDTLTPVSSPAMFDQSDKYSSLYELQEPVDIGSKKDVTAFSDFSELPNLSSPTAPNNTNASETSADHLYSVDVIPTSHGAVIQDGTTSTDISSLPQPVSKSPQNENAFAEFGTLETLPLEMMTREEKSDGITGFNAFGNLPKSDTENNFSEFSTTTNESFGDFAAFETTSPVNNIFEKSSVSEHESKNTFDFASFDESKPRDSKTGKSLTQTFATRGNFASHETFEHSTDSKKEHSDFGQFANFDTFNEVQTMEEKISDVSASEGVGFADFSSHALSPAVEQSNDTSFGEFTEFTSADSAFQSFEVTQKTPKVPPFIATGSSPAQYGTNITTQYTSTNVQSNAIMNSVLMPESTSSCSVDANDKYSIFKNIDSVGDVHQFSLPTPSNNTSLAIETSAADPNDKYSVFKSVNTENKNQVSQSICNEPLSKQPVDTSFGNFKTVSSIDRPFDQNAFTDMTLQKFSPSPAFQTGGLLNSGSSQNSSTGAPNNFTSIDTNSVMDKLSKVSDKSGFDPQSIQTSNFANFDSAEASEFTDFSGSQDYASSVPFTNTLRTSSAMLLDANNFSSQPEEPTNEFANFASFEGSQSVTNSVQLDSFTDPTVRDVSSHAVKKKPSSNNDEFGEFTDFQTFSTKPQPNTAQLQLVQPVFQASTAPVQSFQPGVQVNFAQSQNSQPGAQPNVTQLQKFQQDFQTNTVHAQSAASLNSFSEMNLFPKQSSKNDPVCAYPAQQFIGYDHFQSLKSNQNVRMPHQTNQIMHMQQQPNQDLSMQHQANQNFGSSQQSNQNFHRQQQANQNFITQQQANQVFSTQQHANQNFSTPQQANQNFRMSQQANHNFGIPPQANQSFHTHQNFGIHVQSNQHTLQQNRMYNISSQNQYAPNQQFTPHMSGFVRHANHGGQLRQPIQSNRKYQPPTGKDPFASLNLKSNAEQLSLPVTNKTFQKSKPKLNQMATKGPQ